MFTAQLAVANVLLNQHLDDLRFYPQDFDMTEIRKTYYPKLIRRILVEHEGYKYKPYKDTKGLWTIGIGHNLEAHPIKGKSLPFLQSKGLTGKEIDILFEEDLARAEKDAKTLIPSLDTLLPEYKAVIVSLSFQLGFTKFSQFKKAIAAANKGDWKTFRAELKDSLWYKQVTRRADSLLAMISDDPVFA